MLGSGGTCWEFGGHQQCDAGRRAQGVCACAARRDKMLGRHCGRSPLSSPVASRKPEGSVPFRTVSLLLS